MVVGEVGGAVGAGAGSGDSVGLVGVTGTGAGVGVGFFVGSIATLSSGAGNGAGVMSPLIKLVSWWRAAMCESVSGVNDNVGDGWCRAWTMSVMLARIKSFEEARGIVSLVGNHDTVSEICSDRVSNIQMR